MKKKHHPLSDKYITDGSIFVHDDHIDVNIGIEDVPFEIKPMEKFFCIAKTHSKTRGTKIDGRLEFAINKYRESHCPICGYLFIKMENKFKCPNTLCCIDYIIYKK